MGVSLCSLSEYNFFDARAVFSVDSCHVFLSVCWPNRYDRCCNDQNLYWMLSGASSLKSNNLIM